MKKRFTTICPTVDGALEEIRKVIKKSVDEITIRTFNGDIHIAYLADDEESICRTIEYIEDIIRVVYRKKNNPMGAIRMIEGSIKDILNQEISELNSMIGELCADRDFLIEEIENLKNDLRLEDGQQ